METWFLRFLTIPRFHRLIRDSSRQTTTRVTVSVTWQFNSEQLKWPTSGEARSAFFKWSATGNSGKCRKPPLTDVKDNEGILRRNNLMNSFSFLLKNVYVARLWNCVCVCLNICLQLCKQPIAFLYSTRERVRVHICGSVTHEWKWRRRARNILKMP